MGYEVRLTRRLETECRKKSLPSQGTGEAILGTQELDQGSQALKAVCLELADRDGIFPSTPAAPSTLSSPEARVKKINVTRKSPF